jgi:hypothetical protein
MEQELKIGEYTLKIYQDGYAENPRSEDNLSRLLFVGKHKHLGDEHNFNPDGHCYSSREDFISRGATHITNYLKKEEGLDVAYITPIHMYTHDGSTISTSYSGQFADRFDSGTCGFAVLTKQDIRENWGIKRVTQDKLKNAIGILMGEVSTLDHFIQDEVYGYELLDGDGEEINSCGGFYGDNPKTNGILDEIMNYVEVTDEVIEELEVA